MALRDADILPTTATPATRLYFDRYVLDLGRGSLLRDGSEIALRPKTFAVLQYLTGNAGRLVSKDELFAAVWPALAVTDDALVQSIGELRRALGDDGARLIKTVPRRGYRLECAVSAVPPHEQPSAPAFQPATMSDTVASPPAARDGGHRPRIGMIGAIVLAIALTAATLSIGSITGWVGTRTNRLAADAPQTAVKPADTKPATTKPAIAVLPLVHQGNDSARGHFADGLTQDIIHALGRFSALTVMSWKAVAPYKTRSVTPEEIGRGLAVGYLVEGQVRESNGRVRVSAQLVETRYGQVLWSGRFEEPLADVFAVQDNIASEVVRAMSVRVTQIARRNALAKPTDSLEAYDLVLRARPASQHPTRANNAEARALLRRAIALDPNYAAAYAALAETYYVATAMGWAESPIAFLERAEELAAKSLSLDQSDVRARVVLGRTHVFRQRHKEAAAELARAVAINPNDADGLAGHGNILMWLGQTDAAIEALEQAQRIDPELGAIDRFALSLAYYLKRRYDSAIEQAARNLRGVDGASFSRVLLAAAYAQHARADDAARVAETARRLDPTYDPYTFGTKFLNAADLDHLREGLRKAGLYPPEGASTRQSN